MSARDEILARLRGVAMEERAMPDLNSLETIRFENRVEHFAQMVKAVGGEVVEMGESLQSTLAECGVDCASVVSPLGELEGEALNPDTVEDVHSLGGVYTAVVAGKVGVAENGAVWVPVEGMRKAHLFACQHIVILLDRDSIVDTMHDAVAQISLEGLDYGAFISGPSKTADIEQALVMGAHGAMKATIILTK